MLQKVFGCDFEGCDHQLVAPNQRSLRQQGWRLTTVKNKQGIVCDRHPTRHRFYGVLPPGGRHHLLTERNQAVISAYRLMERPNMTAVGEQFGISRERVRQILTRELNGSPVQQAIEQRRQFILAHHKEMTAAEIALHFALSQHTIAAEATRLGVHCKYTPYDSLTLDDVLQVYTGSLKGLHEALGLTLGQTQNLLIRFGLRSRRRRGTVGRASSQQQANHRFQEKKAKSKGLCPICEQTSEANRLYCVEHRGYHAPAPPLLPPRLGTTTPQLASGGER